MRDTRCRMSDGEHPPGSGPVPLAGILSRASKIQYLASRIAYPASRIPHHVSRVADCPSFPSPHYRVSRNRPIIAAAVSSHAWSAPPPPWLVAAITAKSREGEIQAGVLASERLLALKGVATKDADFQVRGAARIGMQNLQQAIHGKLTPPSLTGDRPGGTTTGIGARTGDQLSPKREIPR